MIIIWKDAYNLERSAIQWNFMFMQWVSCLCSGSHVYAVGLMFMQRNLMFNYAMELHV